MKKENAAEKKRTPLTKPLFITQVEQEVAPVDVQEEEAPVAPVTIGDEPEFLYFHRMSAASFLTHLW
jgi:hypothetical protein